MKLFKEELLKLDQLPIFLSFIQKAQMSLTRSDQNVLPVAWQRFLAEYPDQNQAQIQEKRAQFLTLVSNEGLRYCQAIKKKISQLLEDQQGRNQEEELLLQQRPQRERVQEVQIVQTNHKSPQGIENHLSEQKKSQLFIRQLFYDQAPKEIHVWKYMTLEKEWMGDRGIITIQGAERKSYHLICRGETPTKIELPRENRDSFFKNKDQERSYFTQQGKQIQFTQVLQNHVKNPSVEYSSSSNQGCKALIRIWIHYSLREYLAQREFFDLKMINDFCGYLTVKAYQLIDGPQSHMQLLRTQTFDETQQLIVLSQGILMPSGLLQLNSTIYTYNTEIKHGMALTSENSIFINIKEKRKTKIALLTGVVSRGTKAPSWIFTTEDPSIEKYLATLKIVNLLEKSQNGQFESRTMYTSSQKIKNAEIYTTSRWLTFWMRESEND